MLNSAMPNKSELLYFVFFHPLVFILEVIFNSKKMTELCVFAGHYIQLWISTFCLGVLEYSVRMNYLKQTVEHVTKCDSVTHSSICKSISATIHCLGENMQMQNCHKKHVPLKGTKKTTLSTTGVCGTEDLLGIHNTF